MAGSDPSRTTAFGVTFFGDAINLIRKHRIAYLILNAYFFGLVVVGMFVTTVNPPLREQMLEQVRQNVQHGFLAPVAEAYVNGNFLAAFVLTFLVNLVLGSILCINVPSLIVPYSGMLVLTIRPMIWGLLFSPIGHPLGVGVYIHYGTLLLEGEAYVLAGLAMHVHCRSFLQYKRAGAESMGQGYVMGLKQVWEIYMLVTAALLVAAFYESFTGVFIMPLLKP